jgi:hypothetical protein
VAYCHVVFTVPQELAPLALQNQRLFYSLLLVFLCASSILANTNREWQDAKVTKISACFTYGSPATEAVGTTFVTEPPENYRMYYSIETVGMTYILYSSFSLPLEHIWQGQNRRAPRLTLNGMTKISIDGHDAHILDDDGKDVTVSVFEKITKSK